MSQVRASSHKYTHVEIIKNLREENFKSTVAHNCHGKRITRNLTAKTMTSRQKEKHYDKRKRLATKRITTTSQQKKKELKTLKCPLGIEEILP